MSREITHRIDEKGVLRQIVSPARLRQILDEDCDDYERPEGFEPEDEWKIWGDK